MNLLIPSVTTLKNNDNDEANYEVNDIELGLSHDDENERLFDLQNDRLIRGNQEISSGDESSLTLTIFKDEKVPDIPFFEHDKETEGKGDSLDVGCEDLEEQSLDINQYKKQPEKKVTNEASGKYASWSDIHSELYSIGFVDIDATAHCTGKTRLSIVKDSFDFQRSTSLFFTDISKKYEKRIFRSELQDILLNHAGVLVSKEILDQIYAKADKDGDGFVSADELAAYINNTSEKTEKERTVYVVHHVVKSMTFFFTLLFLFAGLWHLATNLRSQPFGDLHNKEHLVGQIGSWAFLMGCFGFTYLVYKYERMKFEQRQLTYQMLVKWIRLDLPVYLSEEMVKQGQIGFSENSMKNSKREISHYMNKSKSLLFFDTTQKCIDRKILRLILETTGVFLSREDLLQLFEEISDKKNATLKSLMDFAISKQTKMSERDACLVILRQCMRNFGFWTSNAFVLGSICFILSDFVDNPNVLGAGLILYFVGALGGLINVYHSIREKLVSMQRLDAKIRGVAIKLGMLVSLFDKKAIRLSTLRAVRDDNISWFDEIQLGSFQEQEAQHLFDLVDKKDQLMLTELFSTLSELGIYVSILDCKRLWKKFKPDEDGKVPCSDITEYIAKIDPDDFIRHFDVLANFSLSSSFWIVMVQICAGSIQLFAGYYPIENGMLISNLFLAGTVFWTISSSYFMVEGTISKGAKFDQMQESKFLLKEAILQATKEKYAFRNNEVQASMVCAITGKNEKNNPINILSKKQNGYSESTQSILLSINVMQAFATIPAYRLMAVANEVFLLFIPIMLIHSTNFHSD